MKRKSPAVRCGRATGIKLLLAVVSMASVFPLPAADGKLVLVKNGKISYRLSVPEKSNAVETEAIKDLRLIMKQITGSYFAKFHKFPAIYIGRKPDSDTRPLAERERRIRSVGKDIYLYGEGEYGAAFAIYDFLEKQLGCRWYSMHGVEKIPQKKDIVLSPFAIDTVPSFAVIEPGLGPKVARKNIYQFMRRNRMHILPAFTGAEEDDAWNYIGPTCHSLGYYLPPGDVKGNRKGGRMGPSPLLKDKKYFETDPEYFSLRKGKRNINSHYCFSNPEMRREMQKNIDLVIAAEHIPGRKSLISLDINDFNGPLCECENCMALVKKYGGADGSPFFEFVIETGNLFKDKYPDVYFKFIVYGQDMTLIAPDMPEKSFPPNVLPSYSPLVHDVSKSFYSKTNRRFRENFIKWGRLSHHLYCIYTPIHWSYPTRIMSLAAGIDRLVKDMRFMHANGLRYLGAHYSDTIADTYNFKELQLFLMAKLGENINADADALIKEFCDAMYGAAAGDMIQYIRELDAAANADPRFYRWNSSPKILSYVTPENIMRWQKHFDAMTAKVQNDPAALHNVNTARMDLDQNTVYIWKKMVQKYPELKGKVRIFSDRYRKNWLADAGNRFRHLGKGSRGITTGYRKVNFARGIDIAEKAAVSKPLPPAFSKFAPGTVYEAYPEVEMAVTDDDPEGAAGVSITVPLSRNRVRMAYQDNGIGGSVVPNSGNTKWSAEIISRRPPFHEDNLKQLETKQDDFYIYYFGRGRLTYDCAINFRNLINQRRAATFAFGPAWDPNAPDALYDFYISMKYIGNKRVKIDRMITVKVQPGSKDAGITL